MKTTTRRQFLTSAVAGGVAVANLPLISCASGNKKSFSDEELKARYEKLDQVLKQPVFKKELFPDPVIIDTLELLTYNNVYMCRIRSKDGAEGVAVAHPTISMLIPIYLRTVRSFFIGQDARELDLLLERFFIVNSNYRLNGLAIGVPLSTIEFAILDMMGKIANKSAAQLIGEVHNPVVGVYMATEGRGLPLEEQFERIKREAVLYDVDAIKIRVGDMTGSRDINFHGRPGLSEKLIPMVREHFGDTLTLYADANGFTKDVDDAIRIGRILEDNNYAFYEEPVMYFHFEDIKQVSDALTIPVSNGEQDQNLYNFRWLVANDGLDIVEPDAFYFGGFVRSMRVALMGHAFGKSCVTHMSEGGLGFLYNALFVSALPNATPHTEFKGFRTNVPYECPTAEMKVVKGKMKAPSGPGMGVVFDPDFIEKLQEVRS